MPRTTIRIWIALSALLITGIVLTQIYWMRNEYELQERQFLHTVTKALHKVASRVAQPEKDSPVDVQVIAHSPADYLVNLNVPFDSQKLNLHLDSELALHQIQTPFYYGLYNTRVRQIIYQDPNQQTTDPLSESRVVKPIPSPYYFVVHFPGQVRYLTQQMDFEILLSTIVLLLTAFFVYFFYGLFRQKSRTEEQREFMSNMTHELQTPIASIRLAADILLSPKIIEQPERMRKYVRMVQEETMRLQQQVETVLTVARTEDSNGIKLHPICIDMHELLYHLAERHGDYLHLELDAQHAIIQADRMHLVNVIGNLVDNALKYTPKNPLIRLTTHNENGQLVVMVQDNGIGIAPEHQPHIFDAYYRAPGANAQSVKGFGLGLSYVQKIIKAHHWKITLHSTLGQGTSFRIRIPQHTAHAQKEIRVKSEE
ncbi:sensor histidine kinase [Larkinella insperata]|uniref:histidine kinase n=1 Tax=Larkinella insperata TaxID=332158 RepID=A0ABW3Q7S8_9BACT|nr:HAMP domain-containing sensor histidine kinase [Larkinella insperata]